MGHEQQLRFGPFRLAISNEQLWRDNLEIRLQPKAFALLRLLAQHSGQLLTKERLLEALWPNVHITEGVLPACVKDVRRALKDNARRPQFIETVHRRGYRFIATVSHDLDQGWISEAGQQKTHRRFRKRDSDRQVLLDKPSIAVLAFDNMSEDQQQEYFADGIVEDIITQLSRFSDLLVIARNSSFAYRDKPIRIQEVGRKLCVHYIVHGSVRRFGDRVRIAVQLVDALTGSHLWGDRYDRPVADIFDLQDDITQTIVGTLPGRVAKAHTTRLKREPPDDMAAYDYLLAGKVHHHRNTKEDNAKALRLLNKAIAIDPEFADAYAWKACILGQAAARGYARSPDEAFRHAREAIAKALSLDENNVECHRILCEVNMSLEEWDRAGLHHDIAYRLNPNDPRIVAQRGELRTRFGRPKEGVEWVRKAMQLDPYDANDYAHLLGRALCAGGLYADAIDSFKQVRVLQHTDIVDLVICYSQLHLDAEAASYSAELLKLKPDFSINAHMRRFADTDNSYRGRYLEGLRRAGLSEFP